MPIRPENRGRYPADWKEISRRIRFDRGGGSCECTGQCGLEHHGKRCGAPHNQAIGRFKGSPVRWELWSKLSPPRRRGLTRVRIILTCAHLDHTPENCDDENLLGLCQLCHNRLDAPHRAETRRATAEAASRQVSLFGGGEE